jgi:hypothetical protein
MAINKRFTQLNNSGSNHNLLDAYSGKVTGSFEVTGAAYFAGGLSGSLTKLVDGSDYLLAGPYITLATNSLGQIEITGSAGSSSPEYWTSDVANAIWTSGSVLARGGDTTTAASDYGTDTFFFVSGAIDGVFGGNGVAAFGGDVVVSGNLIISGVNSALTPSGLTVNGDTNLYRSLYVGIDSTNVAVFSSQLTASAGIDTPTIGNAGGNGPVTVIAQLTASVGLEITGSSAFAAGSTFTFNGDGVFAAGLTGSLQEVSAGVPYLLAGDYITIATNSLGQIAISASNIPSSEVYWQSTVANNIFTTGSIAVTGSAVISSSLTVNPAGTGRGLLKFGGLDIGPITGSLYMPYTDGTETGILNGNILSASNGVWDGTNTVVLRHELHVLGLGYGAFEGGPTQMFAATYLVMSYIDASGVQAVQAVTEVSRETSGSLAAGYDINFASNGNIEASASLDFASGYVVWYAQRVKEMSLNYVGAIT